MACSRSRRIPRSRFGFPLVFHAIGVVDWGGVGNRESSRGSLGGCTVTLAALCGWEPAGKSTIDETGSVARGVGEPLEAIDDDPSRRAEREVLEVAASRP